MFECSGPGPQTVYIYQDGYLDITTSSHDNTDGINVENITLGTGVKLTQEGGGSISADNSTAINVINSSIGSTLIETSGNVSSSTGIGVVGTNAASALDLTINQKGGILTRNMTAFAPVMRGPGPSV